MKVLVVEDDALVGLDLADTIMELGHQVVGPVMTVEAALSRCQPGAVEFAVLDFNLGKETSEPVADALITQGVPFVFLTGYLRTALPESFRKMTILSKPVNLTDLEKALLSAAAS